MPTARRWFARGGPTAPSSDLRSLYLLQGLRAFLFGMGSVLLGHLLAAQGFGRLEAGGVFTALLVGNAAANLALARVEPAGRRRCYAALYLLLAASGLLLGLSPTLTAILVAALLGVLSPDVIESGPFTSLEQAMIPQVVAGEERTRAFAVYNAVAAVSGSLGALAAAGAGPGWFLFYLPAALVGALVALRLSPRVEAPPAPAPAPAARLGTSRIHVQRLAVLFALDSFGGGFVVQSFVSYWFTLRFGVGLDLLGPLFFGVGLLQSLSFLAAVRLARRIGLLATMVFTHLPSNVFLALIPLAPDLPSAIALLLARHTLSQMDVPTRQAYLAALVPPEERTAAAGLTNSARLVVRPFGPLLAGLLGGASLPFLVAGGLKIAYDLGLYLTFRDVRLEEPPEAAA